MKRVEKLALSKCGLEEEIDDGLVASRDGPSRGYALEARLNVVPLGLNFVLNLNEKYPIL